MLGARVLVAACCAVGAIVGIFVITAASPGMPAAAGRVHGPARCSAKAPTKIPANPWAPAMQQLARSGATMIRLCRYTGLNGAHPLRLARSASVTRARLVRVIVREFDRLPRFAPGAIACPMDDGSQIVARLSYPGGHSVSISVGLSGCTRVTNGDVVRTALGIAPSPHSGPALLKRLEHLTRYRSRHR